MIAPNTTLQNRYLILRLLAQGGMGAVYEARDQRLGNIVALKETFFTDDAMREAFHREASLLAGLRHQSLPKVTDHFAEGNGQFLVMEYIRGDDLGKLLEMHGRAIPPPDVLVWGDQLLGALEYIHTHRPPIIHRDIKPQNLKLNERGELILLDFGLAKGKAGEAEKSSLSVRGYTLSYAPLEQIQGLGTDPRSDLYSAAATLYHLMTGVVPPDAVTRASAHISGQPDPLRPAYELNPQVSPAVSAVLYQALAQDRNRRQPDATSLRANLRQAASESPQAAPATNPPAGLTQSQPPAITTAPSPPKPFTQFNSAAPVDHVPATGLRVEPKKSKNGWRIGIAAIALVLVLALLAGIASWVRNRPEKTDDTSVSDPTVKVPDLKNARPLTAKEILARGSEQDGYYTFIAQPGELTFTLNVIANGSTVTVEAFDREKKPLTFEENRSTFSLASTGYNEQAITRLVNDHEQPLLLHIRTTYPKDLQAFRLRIDGAGAGKLAEAKIGSQTSPLAALFAERDQPKPLATNEIYTGQGNDKDQYYTFTAGPGEIKLTLNVIANGSTITVDLFDDKAEEVKFSNGAGKFSLASTGHNEQGREKLVLGQPQKLLLRIVNSYPKDLRAYRLRIEGPVQLAAADAASAAASAALSPMFADRDKPELLRSKEVTGRNVAKDTYYAFTAGPGTLKLILAIEGDGATLTADLFDSEAKELHFDDSSARQSVSSSGKPEQKSAGITLDREQQVLLRLSNAYPDSTKNYRLQLDGPVKTQ